MDSMDSMIASLAQVGVEEVYVEDNRRCEEPLDCVGCGICDFSNQQD
jgi:hypothetical protein